MSTIEEYLTKDEAALRAIASQTKSAYSKSSWKDVPIVENEEPLVKIPWTISFPYYSKVMGLSGGEDIYLRKTVASRFFRARGKLLCFGYDLRVYDGWRSIELQENLFWFYLKEFALNTFPQIKVLFENCVEISEIKERFYQLPVTDQKILMEANCKYVSWPSSDLSSPSPHSTGGAVDVWLFKEDKPLDLGVPFDWMEESAGAFFHLRKDREKFSNDEEVRKHRTALILAMVNSGFSCYEPEFWHFNLGNQMDGLVKGTNACYSYIEP